MPLNDNNCSNVKWNECHRYYLCNNNKSHENAWGKPESRWSQRNMGANMSSFIVCLSCFVVFLLFYFVLFRWHLHRMLCRKNVWKNFSITEIEYRIYPTNRQWAIENRELPLAYRRRGWDNKLKPHGLNIENKQTYRLANEKRIIKYVNKERLKRQNTK